MSFIKIPTKGMRDFTPREMELREYVLNVMKETYKEFGFEIISTPVVEHIENLTGKEGGENEKLIFKVLKRGEKLDLDSARDENDLVDSGLRYDLTVPLTRFYANNMNDLISPFRSFQYGTVYRAERPQKGRFREFMQCDLDIFGEKTNLAEIELIEAVVTFLKELSFINFEIRINDRRILLAMIEHAGLPVDKANDILISLDKLDKIFIDGVKQELLRDGYDEKYVDAYLKLFVEELPLKDFCKNFEIDDSIVNNLDEIMKQVTKDLNCKIVFDPTLVRGMGYYTGPIFEIRVDDLASSIGGGGRYDNMVSNFINQSVPACGFSVGFERLVLLLEERGFVIPSRKEKIAYVVSDKNNISAVLKEANEKRNNNQIVAVYYKSKNYKHQKEVLESNGFTIIED